MKRQINKKTENIQQYITIFTEDNWQKEKSKIKIIAKNYHNYLIDQISQ